MKAIVKKKKNQLGADIPRDQLWIQCTMSPSGERSLTGPKESSPWWEIDACIPTNLKFKDEAIVQPSWNSSSVICPLISGLLFLDFNGEETFSDFLSVLSTSLNATGGHLATANQYGAYILTAFGTADCSLPWCCSRTTCTVLRQWSYWAFNTREGA